MRNNLKRLLISICAVAWLINLPTAVADESIDNSCPTAFGQLSVHQDAKLCQIFDANDSSAFRSLSYYAPVEPQQLIEFYQNAHPQLQMHSSFNQYQLLTVADLNTRIVISDDGAGAQVDILIR